MVATVDNLNDVLNFDSGDIDSMDDDAGDTDEPTPIGHWTATSSHDVYMVDTLKEATTRKKGMEREIAPSKSNQSVGVNPDPSPASIKTQP